MRLPDDIREALFVRVKNAADREGWLYRSDGDKSALYSAWSRDPDIGGVLQGYMKPNEVHRYLKDTLVKKYMLVKDADPARAFAILQIPEVALILETWQKPHGVTLDDGKIIAWSKAEQWKTTIMAVYERAATKPTLQAYGAVLLDAEGRFAEVGVQQLANEAASRLGIQRIIWVP